MDLFDGMRSHVGRDHAMIEPGSFVTTSLPGWENTQGVVLIAPQMGARFTQYLAIMEAGAVAATAAPGVERCAFVLDGSLSIKPREGAETRLGPGGFVFIPADDPASIQALSASRINVFEKHYVSRPGISAPRRIVGHEQDVKGEPFLGDSAARLQVLLPDEPSFDMAVNVFRFQPGAALPFVEIHVMEHGLLMIAGRGVYRLSDRWYPVRSGDVIWMAPFCPQWFVAMGPEPAAYLYYKDVNRDPLEVNR